MAKETTIKLSSVFKEVLRREKRDNETFEQIIKRLINSEYTEKKSSIPQSIPNFKQIDVPRTEFIEEKKETPTLTYADDPIPSKVCDVHGLPARYCSIDRIWLCPKCEDKN